MAPAGCLGTLGDPGPGADASPESSSGPGVRQAAVRNCRHCDTRSHVVSELVEEVWLMPET